MATTKKVFEWNKFTWLSDSSIIWASWQYDNSSYNIDTQTEPNWVKLTPQPQEYHTTTDTPTVILNLSDYWETWILTFTEDWKVYQDWALIYTLSSWDKIYDAIWQYDNNWKFFVLFFTRNSINRMELSDPVWVDENWKTFKDVANRKNPLNIYWNIYFVSWNIFYKLDDIWELSTFYTFPKQDNAVWITFFQDNFNIYTSWWNYWRQYIFPIWNDEPYYNIEWKWLPILWAINAWWLDYVTTWYNSNYSDLYVVSWTQRKWIKINSEWPNSRWFSWVMHTRLNDVYIAWNFINSKKLFKFWNYYNWFNQELLPYLDFSNDVSSMNSTSNVLYIWTEENKVYSVNLNSIPDDYQTDWEITSFVFDFSTPDTKKFLNEIIIAYDNRNTNMSNRWWSFVLYARKSETDWWTELYTTWNLSDTWNISIYQTQLAEKWFSDFYQLQFKIKLVSDSNNKTPFFKKLKVIYTDDIK